MQLEMYVLFGVSSPSLDVALMCEVCVLQAEKDKQVTSYDGAKDGYDYG